MIVIEKEESRERTRDKVRERETVRERERERESLLRSDRPASLQNSFWCTNVTITNRKQK